jgi:O-antigen/teichoic acid export membrane protein
MDKKQVIKDFFVYSIGNYVSQIFGMVSGFLLRVFLEPYYMGIWQGFDIITSYTSYTNLGVSRSAARDIPYYIGKGDHEKAETLKNVGFTFSLFTIAVVAAGCIVFALWEKKRLPDYVFWGFITVGIVITLERAESYIVGILRAKKQFFFESVGRGLTALVNIILIVLLVSRFKLFGLYAGNIIVFVFSISIFLMLSRERYRLSIDKKELKQLIKIGIPLVILGFMSINLTNIDRIIILKMLGPEKLGLYSVPLMAGNLVYNISNMASIVLYPRFQELYGKSDKKKDVYELMAKVTKRLLLPFLVLIIGAMIFMPFVIKFFMPKYIPAINAMQIFLVGKFFFSLSLFSSNFLVTINKQILNVYICAVTILLNAALAVLFIAMGYGIEGVALATSISFTAYSALLFIASKYVIKHEK